jgi:uncharacterized protein YgbK (DUF1537 family)
VSGRTADVLAGQLHDDLDRSGVTILATERIRFAEHGTLDHGAQVMAALIRVVSMVAADLDSVVTKGGITSAEVATGGLGGKLARARGQISTGVPLWDVSARHGRTIPQAVVPGNVGDDMTLTRVCGFFGRN